MTSSSAIIWTLGPTFWIQVESIVDVLAQIPNESIQEKWVPFGVAMTIPIDERNMRM
jgi:hypothetical protein